MTAVITMLVTGVVLLLLGMIILVYLNWSTNVSERVLSIALIGIATVLASVIVTLKESSVDSAFTVPVILDSSVGFPPLIVKNPENRPFISSLADLARLGQPARNQDGKTVVTVGKPSETERSTFCGELLQYQVLKLIRKFQRGGWKFGMVSGYAVATVNTPMKLTEIQSYPGEAFLSTISPNRFSNSDMEQFDWQNVTFPLPKIHR